MSLEKILEQELPALGQPCSDEILSKFRRYADLLTEANTVMNLTAIAGEENIARLHFLDCAAAAQWVELDGKSAADVGSGAGFPGVVLKILHPSMRLVLIDSLGKRINFLQDLCRNLEFENVECIHARAEDAARGPYRETFDAVLARAVAKLSVLNELCLPLTRQGGLFLALKGPDCRAEVQEAASAAQKLGARFRGVKTYSVPGTEAVHSVVIYGKNGITASKYPRPWAQIRKKPL